MTWTKKYWDVVDQFYWAPQYLGLKSIPQNIWEVDGDKVSIPIEMINPKGPLYRRLKSGEEYWSYVRRQEETFNHIFDIVFGILPGDVICDILSVPTNIGTGHSYESYGRELCDRYGWGEHSNITTPDGFFIAADSVLAVELKFNAKTSLDQLAKYLMLFVSEEVKYGRRANVDLLFIFNSDPVPTFKKQMGFEQGEISQQLFGELRDAAGNKRVVNFFNDNENEIRSVLGRLRIHCIDWQFFSQVLSAYASKLSETPGDCTLKKLLGGLVTEISNHPLSGV